MTKRGFAVLFLFAVFCISEVAVAQDVLSVAGTNRTGAANATITVPVFLKDVAGTLAGRDQADVADRIADFDVGISFPNAAQVAGCLAAVGNCEFFPAGVLSSVKVAPVEGSNPCDGTATTGCSFYAVTRSADSITVTVATPAPMPTTADAVGDLMGYFRIKLSSTFAGPMTINNDADAAFAGGTDNASAETVANGQLQATNTAIQRSILDVDANGSNQGFTDGVMILRRAFGFPGATVIQGALGTGATRTAAADIQAYIDSMRLAGNAQLDIDGNGLVQPFTDGVLILRYFFGFRGATLITGAIGAGATRTTAAQIEARIAEL